MRNSSLVSVTFAQAAGHKLEKYFELFGAPDAPNIISETMPKSGIHPDFPEVSFLILLFQNGFFRTLTVGSHDVLLQIS